MEKTNVMRILERLNVSYTPHEYDSETDKGEEVAAAIGKSADEVFKTLVTTSPNGNYVFIIPVNCSLNLKKAARTAGVKSIEMLKQKELLPLTGYVHGGCSPFGMKKTFPTFIEETAILFPAICVSAGKRGYQVELSPEDIIKNVPAEYGDLCD